MKKTENEIEVELYDLKWFDYRVMPPDVATFVFFRDWARAAKTYNELLGYHYTNVLRGYPNIDFDDLKCHRNWNTLTKLRRFADKNCLPYPKFWQWINRAHNEMGFHKLFLNVYLNSRLQAKALEYRDEYVENLILYSDNPLFDAQNYKGYRIQDEYYEYLIRQLVNRYGLDDFFKKVKKLISNGKMAKTYLDSSAPVICSILKGSI